MCRLSDTTDITIAIRNSSPRVIVVYLEPWGEEFRLAPQDELVLVGYGPRAGSGYIVEYIDAGVVITAWTGSVVRVFSHGRELGSVAQRPPVPDFD